MTDGKTEALTVHDMKRKPIFSEINVETGHPEIAVDNLAGKLEDMGFKIERGPNSISNDDIAEGVKDYREYLEADRTEQKFRKYAKEYKKYAWIVLGLCVLFIILTFISDFNNLMIMFTVLFIITTIVLYILAKPKNIKDNIYIRVAGKVYAGTKSREMRDSSHNKAATTKSASTAYVHSEVKFVFAGDSEISVERLRSDIGTISKYLQKI